MKTINWGKITGLFLWIVTVGAIVGCLMTTFPARVNAGEAPACSSFTIATFANDPEVQAKLKAQEGEFVILRGNDEKEFMRKLETAMGSEAPFPHEEVLLVHPTADSDDWNIAYFHDGCVSDAGKLPDMMVRKFLGREPG